MRQVRSAVWLTIMAGAATALSCLGGDKGGGDQGPKCFAGAPNTHDEIINACPAAGVEFIDKQVILPGGFQVGQRPLPEP